MCLPFFDFPCLRKKAKKDLSKIKVLFLLKRREDYSCNIENCNDFTVATGMYNSSKFMSDMLNERGIQSNVEVVIDNNCIDRMVHKYKPTHVFIEGLWVIPSKFDVLKPLHKNVKWIVRIHSDIPFLATEGVSFGWVHDYLTKGVYVAANSPRMHKEFLTFSSGFSEKIDKNLLPLLTNYYPKVSKQFSKQTSRNELNIGCFGAVRPLKAHMPQALAAYDYAKKNGKYLKFHINGNRVEGNGSPILKNLRQFFENLTDAELVEHPWNSHEKFLQTIANMDVLLQVSFSETFNIVTADAISQNVPVVVSKEVPFLKSNFADPTNTDDISKMISEVLRRKECLIYRNKRELDEYCEKSALLWMDWFKSQI